MEHAKLCRKRCRFSPSVAAVLVAAAWMYCVRAGEPNNVSALHERAKSAEAKGDYGKARNALKEALELDKTDATRQLLIEHYVKYGDEEDGGQLLADLAGDGKLGADLAERVARELLGGRRYALASDFLRHVLPSHEKNYRLRFLHAAALEECARWRESIDTFLSLLDTKKELPGVSAPDPDGAMSRASLASGFEGILPEEALSFVELAQANRDGLYGYRVPPKSRSPDPSKVSPVPESVERLPAYVICHLVRIYEVLDVVDREALVEVLAEKGVSYPELKLCFDESSMLSQSFYEKACKRHPDDEAIVAVRVVSRAHGFRAQKLYLGERFSADAFAMFRRSRPQLAAMAALSTCFSGEPDEALLTEALDLLESLSSVTQGTLLAAYSTLTSYSYLSGALKRQVRSALRRVMSRVNVTGPWSLRCTRFVAQMLMAEHDYEGLVRFLDQVFSQTKPNPRTAPRRWLLSPYSRQVAHKFPFPPQYLPAFSIDFRALFHPPEHVSQLGIDARIQKEKLWPHVASATHPLLRVLLTAACDKAGETEREVEELLKSREPALEELVLAAGWEAHQGQVQEAVALLDRARGLSENRDTLLWIDSTILAYAAEAADKQALTQPARAAALRVAASDLDRARKSALARVMKQFDLQNEAAEIERSLATTSSTRKPAQPAADLSSIGALFRRGQKAQAIRKAAREFRRRITYVVRTSGSPSSAVAWGPLRPRWALEPIARHQAEAEFLAYIAAPADSKDVRRICEFAAACECLGQPERALEQYSRILAQKEGHRTANLRLSMLLYEEDRDRALAYLQRAARTDFDRVGDALAGRMCREPSLSGRLRWMPLVVCLLQIQPQPAATYQWVTRVLGALELRSAEQFKEVPPLFDASPERLRDLPQDARALVAQRLKAYERLCGYLVSDPQTAEAVFVRKRRLVAFLGQDEAPLFDLAKVILTRKSALKRIWIRRADHNDPPTLKGDACMPDEFLVSFAVRNGRQQELVAFIEQLESQKGGNPYVSRRLRRLKALYEASDEQFLETAKAFGEHAVVLRAWRETKKTVSLAPFVLDLAQGVADRGLHYHMPFVAHWAKELQRIGDDRAAARFFDELCRTFFSDADRQALAEATRDSSAYRNPLLTHKSYGYTGLLRRLMEEKTLLFPALEAAHGVPGLPRVDDLTRHASKQLRKIHIDWAWLKSTPFLREWGEFRFYPVPQRPGHVKIHGQWRSLFQQVLSQIGDDKSKGRAQIERWLLLNPQTFGIGLLRTELDPRPVTLQGSRPYVGRLTRLLNYLAKHRDLIADGPSDLRRELIDHLGAASAAPRSSQFDGRLLTEAGKAFYDYYQRLRREEGTEDVDEFLKTATVGHSPAHYRSEAAELLKRWASRNEKKAIAVLAHSTKALEQAGSSGRREAAQLVYEVTESARKAPRVTRTLCRKALEYDLLSCLRRLNDNVDYLALLDFGSVEGLKTNLLQYEKECGQAGPVAVSVPIYRRLRSARESDLLKVRQWSTGEAARSTLLREAALIAEMILQRQGKERLRRFTLTDPLIAHYKAVIENEALSPAGRYNVYERLSKELGRSRSRPGRYGEPGENKELEALLLPAAEALLEIGTRGGPKSDGPRIARPKGAVPVGVSLKPFTLALARLPTSPEWRKVAARFAARWDAQLRKEPRHGRIKPGPALALAITDLYFRLGQPEAAFRLLSRRLPSRPTDPLPYVVPLRYGQSDWCRAQFEQHWQDLSSPLSHPRESSLTPAMREAADKVVAGIASPDLRLLADLFYATFPTCEVTADGIPDWQKIAKQDRLAELADRVLAHRFEDLRIRDKCLSFSLRDPSCVKLKPVLYEICGREDIVHVCYDKTPKGQERGDRFLKYLEFLLDDGRVDVFRQHLEGLKRCLAAGNPHEADNMLYRVCEAFRAWLRNERPLRGKREDYLTLAKELYEVATPHRRQLTHRLLGTIAALYYACGREKQLPGFLEGFGEAERKGHEAYARDPSCALPVFRKMLGPISEENASARLRRFLSFCTDPNLAPYIRAARAPHDFLLRKGPYRDDWERWQLMAVRFYLQHGQRGLAWDAMERLRQYAKKDETKKQLEKLREAFRRGAKKHEAKKEPEDELPEEFHHPQQ